jgi:hypothetical protein
MDFTRSWRWLIDYLLVGPLFAMAAVSEIVHVVYAIPIIQAEAFLELPQFLETRSTTSTAKHISRSRIIFGHGYTSSDAERL